jgi:hypothetical protein
MTRFARYYRQWLRWRRLTVRQVHPQRLASSTSEEVMGE